MKSKNIHKFRFRKHFNEYNVVNVIILNLKNTHSIKFHFILQFLKNLITKSIQKYADEIHVLKYFRIC